MNPVLHGEFVLTLDQGIVPVFFSHAQIVKGHSYPVSHPAHFLSDVLYAPGFEEANGRTAHTGHVFWPMTRSNPASIFIINGINDVMASIFNDPMTTVGG